MARTCLNALNLLDLVRERWATPDWRSETPFQKKGHNLSLSSATSSRERWRKITSTRAVKPTFLFFIPLSSLYFSKSSFQLAWRIYVLSWQEPTACHIDKIRWFADCVRSPNLFSLVSCLIQLFFALFLPVWSLIQKKREQDSVW